MLGEHLWAQGYFCGRSGNFTGEVIQAYMANQNQGRDTTFRVDGEESA